MAWWSEGVAREGEEERDASIVDMVEVPEMDWVDGEAGMGIDWCLPERNLRFRVDLKYQNEKKTIILLHVITGARRKLVDQQLVKTNKHLCSVSPNPILNKDLFYQI